MKIFKPELIFVSFVLISTAFCTEQSIDYISVDKNIDCTIDTPRPDVQLNATYPKYKTIETELNKLKRRNCVSELISLDDETSKGLAPTLHEIISKALIKLCSNAKIAIPKISIYSGTTNDTYNAAAKQCIEYIRETKTITQGRDVKTFVKDSKNKKCTLVLGEELIKLLLWNFDGEIALESIIAHEVGHMRQEGQMQPKIAEFDADATAVKLVGRANGDQLIKSINMSTLAGHIFNILAGQADIFRLSLEDVHQLNRIITNSMVRNYYSLGDLGQSSSHLKFGTVINKVFQDALKYSFDPKVGLTENNFFKIYEKLEKACKDMADFMGADKEAEMNLRCAYIEEYSDKFYSPITHPTPEQRYLHLKNCINSAL